MIDTHCHCLFGVDDGAESIQTSIEMLKEANDDGIAKVFCTPHCTPGGKYPNDNRILSTPFEKLKDELNIRGIKIELYLGTEVFFMKDTLKWAKEKRLVTLNGTDRILLEFPWYGTNEYFEPLESVTQLRKLGYRIILAHPERYPFIQKDYGYLERLRNLGCNFQVNRTSLVFKEDSNYDLAWRIVEDGLADVIASDAHRPHAKRSIILSDGYVLIEKKYGKAEADRLFVNNPQALIDGNELLIKKDI